MVFIAGSYTATYNGLVVGNIEDGFELDYGAVVEDITSDHIRARIDGVFQGIDMTVKAVLIEPTQAGAALLAWPWHAGTSPKQMGVPGRLMSTMAQALVLTACVGNSAAPASITFTKAILWTDRVSSIYGNTLRKVPITIAVLPQPIAPDTVIPACYGGSFFTFA